jgi:hypothetical protein
LDRRAEQGGNLISPLDRPKIWPFGVKLPPPRPGVKNSFSSVLLRVECVHLKWWICGCPFVASTGPSSGAGQLTNPPRVARWYIFKQKIPICVNFGVSSRGRCSYIFLLLGIFTAIWYFLWPFRKFFGHFVML